MTEVAFQIFPVAWMQPRATMMLQQHRIPVIACSLMEFVMHAPENRMARVQSSITMQTMTVSAIQPKWSAAKTILPATSMLLLRMLVIAYFRMGFAKRAQVIPMAREQSLITIRTMMKFAMLTKW